MSGKPWFKFYPTDWRADEALRMCDMPTRGLWIELVCLMAQAEPVGFLRIKGEVPTDEQLAILVGMTVDGLRVGLTQLERFDVFSRQGGVIYSRKMLRDVQKSESAKSNGRKGGSPKLRGGPCDQLKPEVKVQDKPQSPDTRDQIDSLSTREVPELDFDRVSAEAGGAMASLATHPRMRVMGELRPLLCADPPCDLELDVYPAVAQAAAWHMTKGGERSMKSWATAAAIAIENRDTRLAGVPPPKGPTHDRQSATSEFGPAGRRRAANMERAFAGAFGPAAGRTVSGQRD